MAIKIEQCNCVIYISHIINYVLFSMLIEKKRFCSEKFSKLTLELLNSDFFIRLISSYSIAALGLISSANNSKNDLTN